MLIKTINNKRRIVTINKQKTGHQLKKFIYSKICRSLNVKTMNLFWNNKKIGDHIKLFRLKVEKGKLLTIEQRKIEVREVV